MKNLNKMKIAPDLVCEIGQDKPSWFSKWDVKDDSTLYEKVRKLAHSTFVGTQASNASPLDPKKFIIIGSSVVVTEDGIASNFKAYPDTMLASLIKVNITTAATKSLKIITPLYTVCYENSNKVLRIGPDAADGIMKLCVLLSSNGSSWDIANKVGITAWTNVDKTKFTELTWDGTAYYISYTDTNGNIQKVKVVDSTLPLNTGSIMLGAKLYTDVGYNATTIPIDLKLFSIEIDGVEVFSGNKTGVDTIIPPNFTIDDVLYCFKYTDAGTSTTYTAYANADNSTAAKAPTELYDVSGNLITQSESGWQIVSTTEDDVTTTTVNYNGNAATYTSGSNIYWNTPMVNNPLAHPKIPNILGPKIAEDGTATNLGDGASKAGYIRKTLDFSNIKDSFEFELKFKVFDVINTSHRFLLDMSPNGANTHVLFIYENIPTQMTFNGFPSWMASDSHNFLGHTMYVHGIAYADGRASVTYKDLTANIEYTGTQTTNTFISTAKAKGNVEFKLGSGWYNGEIYLNSVKFKIDGEIVWQPMLNIPYTEAKLNQKVVDVKYRDDVKNLFEQEGYNIYYTLGEDDFTLPSNKPNDIVKYKADGLTVAEQRADQTLTIRGACEQGVDVNLPMEFFSADSYAVFGVGTTGTNTASKFTPAADGNYIAIGKGKV